MAAVAARAAMAARLAYQKDKARNRSKMNVQSPKFRVGKGISGFFIFW